MSSSNISKIEQIHASNLVFSADLYLDKSTGKFFATVGGEKISEDTKVKAVERVRETLRKISNVEWREVIVLRVDKRREQKEDDSSGSENGKAIYDASCSFTYMRRERAKNPLFPRKTIEREHRVEFEDRIAQECKRWNHPSDRKRRDEWVAKVRMERAALAKVEEPWTSMYEKSIEEFEIPYTAAAWEGIQQISAALRATQAKLNEFCRSASTEKLAQLASGNAIMQLMAPSTDRK